MIMFKEVIILYIVIFYGNEKINYSKLITIILYACERQECNIAVKEKKRQACDIKKKGNKIQYFNHLKVRSRQIRDIMNMYYLKCTIYWHSSQ